MMRPLLLTATTLLIISVTSFAGLYFFAPKILENAYERTSHAVSQTTEQYVEKISAILPFSDHAKTAKITGTKKSENAKGIGYYLSSFGSHLYQRVVQDLPRSISNAANAAVNTTFNFARNYAIAFKGVTKDYIISPISSACFSVQKGSVAMVSGISNVTNYGADAILNISTNISRSLSNGINLITTKTDTVLGTVATKISNTFTKTGTFISNAAEKIAGAPQKTYSSIKARFSNANDGISEQAFLMNDIEPATSQIDITKNQSTSDVVEKPQELNLVQSEYDMLEQDEAPYNEDVEQGISEILKTTPKENNEIFTYSIEQEEIVTEAVLVPKEKTVISSSRDGKIRAIYVDNGDHFKKGDKLLEYYCEDLQAEKNAAKAEKRFAKKKDFVTKRLYDIGLSSDLEKMQSDVEQRISNAKESVANTRLRGCTVRATYDGRVVKRIANPNEYTRTDRVLLEVASKETLDAEFLVPSKWLRWVNVGAPIDIILHETEKTYSAKIKRIYGEVDPVSQSIQVRASLIDYSDPLLPGMSGEMRINANEIREAGIKGFLEMK